MSHYEKLDRKSIQSLLRLAGTALSISATAVYGQDKPHAPTTLNAIVTTASSKAQPIRDVQASVQLIDQKDLEAYSGNSVTEALKMAIGVDARAMGSNSNVLIRGFALRPGAMLVDGLRRATKYGAVNPGLLSLQDVSHIEVVRGPMSALYGADANGGAINIKTRSPLLDTGIGGNVRTMFGATTDHHQRRTNVVGASVYFGTDHLRHRMHLEHRYRGLFQLDRSEPAVDLPRNKHTFFAYDGATRLGADHQLRWQAEYIKQHDTGPSLKAGSAYTAYEKEDSWLGSLRYEGLIGPGELSADVAYSYVNGSTTRSFPIIETTRYHQFQSQIRYGIEWETHSLLLGAGFISDRINVDINPNAGQRNNTHLLIQDEWSLPADWTLLAGVRHDRYSDFDSVTTPRLSLQKRIGGWFGRAGFGQAYRAPTVMEQYSKFMRGTVLIVGNPNLKAERNNTWELSLGYQGDTFDTELTYYRSKVRDMIQTVPMPRQPTDPAHIRNRNMYINVARARLEGLELSGQWQITAPWYLQGAWEYLDARDSQSHQRLTGIARQIARAGIRYEQAQWRADLQGRYYFDFYNPDPSIRGSAPINSRYGTLDAKVQYEWSKSLHLALGVDNIFNRHQPDNFNARGSVIDPPARFVYAEVKYAF